MTNNSPYKLVRDGRGYHVVSTERETLWLVLIQNVWHVDYRDSSERARIIELFGSPLVPTPFTSEADVDNVIANIAARNSKYDVRVR